MQIYIISLILSQSLLIFLPIRDHLPQVHFLSPFQLHLLLHPFPGTHLLAQFNKFLRHAISGFFGCFGEGCWKVNRNLYVHVVVARDGEIEVLFGEDLCVVLNAVDLKAFWQPYRLVLKTVSTWFGLEC